MNDIVFINELDDSLADKRVNDYLNKGWTLLHVGTKTVGTIDENGQAIYHTVYVVGANQEQYDKYKQDSSMDTELESIISDLKNNV